MSLRRLGLVFSVVVLFFTLLFFFSERSSQFGFFSSLATPYEECAITSRIRPNKMLIYGSVVSITTSDPEWIVTTISVCSDSKNTGQLLVFTPKAPNIFYSGHPIEIDGKESYQWKYEPTDSFSSFFEKGDLVVVRSERLISEEFVKSSFQNLPDFTCDNEPICYPLIDFVRKYNMQTEIFYKNVSSKNGLSLFINGRTGKNKVYSNRIGTIQSLEKLREYSDGLIIW